MRGRWPPEAGEVVNPGWRDQAFCAGTPDLWFSDPRTREAARARTLCADCPVRYDCLDYAISSRPACGIWAGLDHNQLAAAYGHLHVCRCCGTLFAGGRANPPGYCSGLCRETERRQQQIRCDRRRALAAS